MIAIRRRVHCAINNAIVKYLAKQGRVVRQAPPPPPSSAEMMLEHEQQRVRLRNQVADADPNAYEVSIADALLARGWSER